MVTEPQVWTMIAVFTTLMLGTLTIVATLFVRIMRAEFTAVRTEFTTVRAEFSAVRAESSGGFAAIRAEISGEFAAIRAEIGAVHRRLDDLDRDVQALTKHVFGIDRP